MSRLWMKAEAAGERTILTDTYFTAPLKIARPFYRKNYTEVMMMAASAGMLEGDSYEIALRLESGARIKFTGQSYTKIFQSQKDGASQRTEIRLGEGAFLSYLPRPVIPFGGSIYSAHTDVFLEESSRLFLCDIMSCGRVAMEERFLFSEYRSRTTVFLKGTPVFLDHVWLRPDSFAVSGPGFFEGCHHVGMMYCYGADPGPIPELPGVSTAVTAAYRGTCIRVMGDTAENIYRLAEILSEKMAAADSENDLKNIVR